MNKHDFLRSLHRSVVYTLAEIRNERNIDDLVIKAKEILKSTLEINMILPTDRMVAVSTQIVREQLKLKPDSLAIMVMTEEAFEYHTQD